MWKQLFKKASPEERVVRQLRTECRRLPSSLELARLIPLDVNNATREMVINQIWLYQEASALMAVQTSEAKNPERNALRLEFERSLVGSRTALQAAILDISELLGQKATRADWGQRWLQSVDIRTSQEAITTNIAAFWVDRVASIEAVIGTA